MTETIAQWLDQVWVHRLGWTLVHTVWQGAAVAAGLAVTLAALRRRSPQARYVAACAALAGMLAAAVVTFAVVGEPPARQPPAAAAVVVPTRLQAVDRATAGQQVEALAPASLRQVGPTDAVDVPWADMLEAALPFGVGAWLIGVACLLVANTAGWLRLRRWRRVGLSDVADRHVQAVARLSRRLGVRRVVRVAESVMVQVPTVLGHLRPIILLPGSALTGLTPAQLEAILAHELAHVRRCDYLVNLVQTAVETLLFYHPAAWWIGRRVRIEREHCCDDVAAECCGDRVGYARALATMEALRAAPVGLAVAASGGSLVERVRRIVGLPAESPATRRPRSVAVVLMVVAVVGATAVVLRPSPARAQEQPNPDVVVKQKVDDAVTKVSTLSETSPELKPAVESLRGLDDATVSRALAGYLTDERATVRRAAVFLLFQGPMASVDAARDALLGAMKHDEDLTRGIAALAIGQRKLAGGYDPLVEMATKDLSGYARRCAVYALGLFGDPRAVPVLRVVAKDEDGMVRGNAEAALKLLEPKAPPAATQPSARAVAEQAARDTEQAHRLAAERARLEAARRGHRQAPDASSTARVDLAGGARAPDLRDRLVGSWISGGMSQQQMTFRADGAYEERAVLLNEAPREGRWTLDGTALSLRVAGRDERRFQVMMPQADRLRLFDEAGQMPTGSFARVGHDAGAGPTTAPAAAGQVSDPAAVDAKLIEPLLKLDVPTEGLDHTIQHQVAVVTPGGNLRFASMIHVPNVQSTAVRTTGFNNSDFVEVERMFDRDGRPLRFDVTHAGGKYRYTLHLGAEVGPGKTLSYGSVGTQTRLIKKAAGNEFVYEMRHFPGGFGTTRRIETHHLPAGAELLETSPNVKRQADGVLHVDEMVPAKGSVLVKYRYRLAVEASALPALKLDIVDGKLRVGGPAAMGSLLVGADEVEVVTPAGRTQMPRYEQTVGGYGVVAEKGVVTLRSPEASGTARVVDGQVQVESSDGVLRAAVVSVSPTEGIQAVEAGVPEVDSSVMIRRSRQLYRQAIDAETRGDWREAVDQYERIAELPPEAQMGDLRTRLEAARRRVAEGEAAPAGS